MQQYEQEHAPTQTLSQEGSLRSSRGAGWTQQSFEAAAMRLVREFEEHGRGGDETEAAPRVLSEWTVRSEAWLGTYMVRERPIEVSVAFKKNSTIVNNETANAEIDLEDHHVLLDDHTLHDPAEEPMTNTLWSFSIVFSQTYEVPVLYFTAQRMDGSPCTRQEIVDHLEQLHHQNLVDDSWDFLSMDQHPMTGLHSYFLHPCNTKERMKTMASSYECQPAIQLLGWMSMMLASMGLSIPAKLYQQQVNRLLTPTKKIDL